MGSSEGGGLDPGAVPIFPPLPGDLAEWGEALDARPGLKPCLHRLDDGMAFRLDRTAAAGNGVVPLAAARAYLDLKRALVEGQSG